MNSRIRCMSKRRRKIAFIRMIKKSLAKYVDKPFTCATKDEIVDSVTKSFRRIFESPYPYTVSVKASDDDKLYINIQKV